jgi:ADP-ribosylglycohydrolase
VTDRHDGCGAAIRVAPVSILYHPHRLDDTVRGAREASISRHGGSLAIAAAAATAAAVSAAIDGALSIEIIQIALRAAAQVERDWPLSAGGSITEAVRQRYDDMRRWRELRPNAVADSCFPNSPLTIVPLALVLGTVLELGRGGDFDRSQRGRR